MKKLLILATVAVISSTALAAEKNGGYGGIELGYTRIDDAAQDTANSLVAVNGGSSSVRSDTSMAVGRLFAGYSFNENISAEFGAYRTSDFDQTFSGVTSGSAAYSGTASLYNYGVDYSLLVRPGVATGLNGLFARFGGHWSETNVDVTVTGGSGYAYVRGSGWLAGLGYDAEISKDATVRTSWTYRDKISGEDAYANIGSVALMFKF
jgi:hypothetical protein